MGSRRLWQAQLAFWSAYGISTFLSLAPATDPGLLPALLALKLVRAGLGLLVTAGLERAYSARPAVLTTLRPAVVLALVGSVLGGALWYWLYRYGIRPMFRSFEPLPGSNGVRAALEYVFVLMAWSAGYFFIRNGQIARQAQARLLHAGREQAEVRLLLLTAQLRPHLLFNTLSSLRALITDNPALARRLLTSLAEYLRSVVVASPDRVSTLDAELNRVEHYLAMEGVRLEDRLETTITADPAARREEVPPFLLQPLVENSVKYGEPAADGILRVSVGVRCSNGRVVASVANTGRLTRSEGVSEGLGVGMANVRERLTRFREGAIGPELVGEAGWVIAVLEWPASQADRALSP